MFILAGALPDIPEVRNSFVNGNVRGVGLQQVLHSCRPTVHHARGRRANLLARHEVLAGHPFEEVLKRDIGLYLAHQEVVELFDHRCQELQHSNGILTSKGEPHG